MLLKNKKINTSMNGDIISQFNQFKRQIESSGKNPQEILNDLIASGKVNQSQVNNAINIAKQFSHLIK